MSAAAPLRMALHDLPPPEIPPVTAPRSERAFIAIDGENFRYLVRNLGYQEFKIPDFLACLCARLNIIYRKGIVRGAFVTVRGVNYSKSDFAKCSMELAVVPGIEREQDDKALRERISTSPAGEILVVVSNDLKAYLGVLKDQKRRGKKVFIAGTKLDGWGNENDAQLHEFGIEFIEISEFIDQFAEKIPTPPVQEIPPAPVLLQAVPPPPVGPLSLSAESRMVITDKTTPQVPKVTPRNKQNQIDIIFDPPDHEHIVEATFAVYAALNGFGPESITIQLNPLQTGQPIQAQISFVAFSDMCAQIISRAINNMRKYSRDHATDLPGTIIKSRRIRLLPKE